jgi:hypothetical protein
MDELDLFRHFRRGVAAPSADTRRRASGRLLSVIEEASGREQRDRSRFGGRPRRIVALAAVAVVVVGATSAFATVRELFFVEAKPFARGKLTRTVDGVRFSLTVPKTQIRWENGPHEIGGRGRTHSLFISKSTVGGQAAEAVVFWAGFEGGGLATPCAKVLGSAIGGSSADLAAAVARAPGTKLVNGPRRVTIGGRAATHVVLSVREDLGCEPGYFFSWRPRNVCAGACWLSESSVGNTIRVWIFDVGGTRLFIDAETRKHHAGTGEAVPRRVHREVEQEITKIIESIRFG